MPITDQSQSIVNFDLNAAAQLAAQAATVNVKRPDYGALAAVLPNQQQRENIAPLQFAEYQQTQQQQQPKNNWNFLDQRANDSIMTVCNNENIFNALSFNSINQRQNNLPISNSFFLDSNSNTTYQSQQLLKQSNNNNNNNGNSQLLLSDSNNQSVSDNLFNSMFFLKYYLNFILFR